MTTNAGSLVRKQQDVSWRVNSISDFHHHQGNLSLNLKVKS